MEKIKSPLTPGMDGPAVAALQLALRELVDRGLLLRRDEGQRRELSDALAAEIGSYADATVRAVDIFQKEHRLDVAERGLVDEVTAAALNAVLDELGLLDDGGRPERPRLHVVSGTVRTDDGTPPRGAVVRAYHMADAGPIELARTPWMTRAAMPSATSRCLASSGWTCGSRSSARTVVRSSRPASSRGRARWRRWTSRSRRSAAGCGRSRAPWGAEAAPRWPASRCGLSTRTQAAMSSWPGPRPMSPGGSTSLSTLDRCETAAR